MVRENSLEDIATNTWKVSRKNIYLNDVKYESGRFEKNAMPCYRIY